MWQLPPLKAENILIYLRKSRADDPTLSVEETLSKHERMLDEWVARNLPDIGAVPEENRYREVVSGETLDSRPEVQKMLRRVESPRSKALLIVEPQRLSRGDLEDIGRVVKLLRYSNTIVITLQYTYDLRDERDRDMFERELKRGNEFLEYQKRIMNNGRLLSVSRGNYIAQRAPYGYKKVKFKEGKSYCYTLEPVPEQAKVVKMVFELYSQGTGTNTIADRLNNMGIPSPVNGEWTPESLVTMLSNVHYIGKVRWNYRSEVKTIEDGEVKKSRPRAEDCLIYDGKQPAIIEQELWDAVQARRGKIPRNKKNTDGFNPLAGIMFCKCGRAMSARPYKTKGIKPRYLCSQQRKCGNASCTMTEVIEQVAEYLKSVIADFEFKIEKGVDTSAEVSRQAVESLRKRLVELQELEITQWDEKTKGGMPQHVFERLNAQTLKEMEEVRQALCTAEDSIPEPMDLRERVSTFRAALEALQNDEAPVRQKNRLLKDCLIRITYSRKRVGNNGHPTKGEEQPVRLHFEPWV